MAPHTLPLPSGTCFSASFSGKQIERWETGGPRRFVVETKQLSHELML